MTHNDGLQVHPGGRNITVLGSNLNGVAPGAGIMLADRPDTSGNLTATNSWFGGGSCSINIYEDGVNASYKVVITDNIFARGSTKNKDCAITASGAPKTKSDWKLSNNMFDDGTKITTSFGIR